MMLTPATVSLLDLLQLLALFVREIDGHLPMRLGNRFVYASGGISPNVSELRRCFVDDGRNFGDLLRRQVELGAKSFLHSLTDQFGAVKSKELMAGIHSSKERATD